MPTAVWPDGFAYSDPDPKRFERNLAEHEKKRGKPLAVGKGVVGASLTKK